jgi:hypothetical protein
MNIRSFLRNTGAHLVRFAAFALALAVLPSTFAQGITTGGLDGSVTDASGKALAGATISALHEPSGTVATTTTRANGQDNLSNLRIGGPYTITATSTGKPAQTAKDVYVDLNETASKDFSFKSDIIQLEKFTVGAERDTTFGSGKMGTSTSLSDKEIENIASVRRNVQDIAATDSRLALMSLDQGGQLSAQGQNFRFNSFTVDGVQATDPFGLNSNGSSSLRSPIPLDAIQSFSVDLAPYDVRRAGATGAYLNAVAKAQRHHAPGDLGTDHGVLARLQRAHGLGIVAKFCAIGYRCRLRRGLIGQKGQILRAVKLRDEVVPKHGHLFIFAHGLVRVIHQ